MAKQTVTPATPWLANSSDPFADQNYQDGNRGGGSEYTITGTGFGTKDSTTPVYEDFEGESVGAAVSPINSVDIEATSGATIISTGALTGSRSLRNDFAIHEFPKANVLLSGTKTKLYHSCHIRYDGVGASSSVWKHSRAGANLLYSGVPRFSAEYTSGAVDRPVTGSSIIVDSNGTTTWDAAYNTASTSATTAYPTATTLFYEFEMDVGTIDNDDGDFYERVSGLDTITFENRPYLTTANSLLPAWIISPMDGHSNAGSLTMIIDNIYVDESRARVVMTNNATYTSSTMWAVQPILTYSSTEVTATRKRQGFSIGATAYLHLFDDSGALVDSGSSFTVAADT